MSEGSVKSTDVTRAGVESVSARLVASRRALALLTRKRFSVNTVRFMDFTNLGFFILEDRDLIPAAGRL